MATKAKQTQATLEHHLRVSRIVDRHLVAGVDCQHGVGADIAQFDCHKQRFLDVSRRLLHYLGVRLQNTTWDRETDDGIVTPRSEITSNFSSDKDGGVHPLTKVVATLLDLNFGEFFGNVV